MKHKLLTFVYFIMIIACILGFKPFAKDAITYTLTSQDPEKTKAKYADMWEGRTMWELPLRRTYPVSGEIVAHITIPAMDYYEIPVYYGSDEINNNWQITTVGYLGNWDMFGEKGVAAVGAHNYQIFQNPKLMQPGDLFLIETSDDIFIYKVTEIAIYDHTKDDWTTMAYDNAEDYSVSLMTCYPIAQGAEATEDTYIVYSTMVRGTKFIER